jgi:hypothetical protein
LFTRVLTRCYKLFYSNIFSNNTNFAVKAGLGIVKVGIAAFVGTPDEVALIRMTADGRLPVN